VEDWQEVESAASECEFVNLAEREITNRVHADEEKVCIIRMECDEIADIGLEPSDLLAARIEWMNKADLISLPGMRFISGALRQRQC
jgi:hypothetical protein